MFIFLPPSLECLNVIFKVFGDLVDSYPIRVLLLSPVVGFNSTDCLLGSVRREEITPCASILGELPNLLQEVITTLFLGQLTLELFTLANRKKNKTLIRNGLLYFNQGEIDLLNILLINIKETFPKGTGGIALHPSSVCICMSFS